MTSETSTSETSQLGPALPVRRRETLEIFDTAFKLYRRYFWVLIGWAAPVAVISVIPFLSILWFLFMPMIYGAVSCSIAAAVRGQSLTFGQAWTFTKPRYGAMLGTLILCGILLFVVYMVFYFAGLMLFFLGMLVFSNVPSEVGVVLAVIAIILLAIGFSVLGVALYGWANMVPVVACLEDDKRGTAAIGRAFDLLKGNWRRLFGISLIMGLAALAVAGIACGALFLLSAVSFNELFSDNLSDSSFTALMLTVGGFAAVFGLLWNPAQALVIGVLYLDLRVRREALDLEWTAYATNSNAPAPTGAVAPNGPAQPIQDGVSREAAGWTPQHPEISPASLAAGHLAAGHVAGAAVAPFTGAVEPVTQDANPLDLPPAIEPESVAPSASVVDSAPLNTPVPEPTVIEPTSFSQAVPSPTVVEPTVVEPTVAVPGVAEPAVTATSSFAPAVPPKPAIEPAKTETKAADSLSFEPRPIDSYSFEPTPVETYTFEPTVIEPFTAQPPTSEAQSESKPETGNDVEGDRA